MSGFDEIEKGKKRAVKLVEDVTEDQNVIMLIGDKDNLKVVHINIAPLQIMNMVEVYTESLGETIAEAVEWREKND